MLESSIFFLDDERERCSEYIEWLEREGFDVCFFDDVDASVEWLRENVNQVSCFIIDCLIPYGDAFSPEETMNGLFTGLAVYHYIREIAPQGKPVLILTNSNDPRIRRELLRDEAAQVLEKGQVLIDELAQIVRELIQEA